VCTGAFAPVKEKEGSSRLPMLYAAHKWLTVSDAVHSTLGRSYPSQRRAKGKFKVGSAVVASICTNFVSLSSIWSLQTSGTQVFDLRSIGRVPSIGRSVNSSLNHFKFYAYILFTRLSALGIFFCL